MLDARQFIERLGERGHTFFTGVPCSFLTPLINAVEQLGERYYLPATSEGEAVAIAAGAWLAGKPAVVLSQNSGLGNMINPITSLNYPFRIPALLIVTWRGEPGIKDEPQHALMGRITRDQLKLIEVPSSLLPTASEELDFCLDEALASMRDTSLPFALVLRNDAFTSVALSELRVRSRVNCKVRNVSRGGQTPPRIAVLERVVELVPTDAAVIATTGKCGRELYTIDDRPQHLYMVGAMGSASAVGLGIALNVERPVVVLDGDGSALMRLGTFATIGAHAPPNLIHIVLDNGVHDSTGGQRTVSASVDFVGVAAACGYASVLTCDDAASFARAFKEALETPGPHLLHIHIAGGSIEPLTRPGIPPDELARRFASFLCDKSHATAATTRSTDSQARCGATSR